MGLGPDLHNSPLNASKMRYYWNKRCAANQSRSKKIVVHANESGIATNPARFRILISEMVIVLRLRIQSNIRYLRLLRRMIRIRHPMTSGGPLTGGGPHRMQSVGFDPHGLMIRRALSARVYLIRCRKGTMVTRSTFRPYGRPMEKWMASQRITQNMLI